MRTRTDLHAWLHVPWSCMSCMGKIGLRCGAGGRAELQVSCGIVLMNSILS